MNKQHYEFWVLANVFEENCYFHYREGEGKEIICWGDVMTAEHYASEDEAREEMVSLLHVYGIEVEPRRVTIDITIE